MKKAAFLISHCESGANFLLDSFNNNPRLEAQASGAIYSNVKSFSALANRPHKLDTKAAINIDLLEYNNQFSFKPIYEFASFIYLIRSPEPTMNMLLKRGYSPPTALAYYTFRLRRIAEMTIKTPNAVFLTWQNLLDGQGLDLIENYLNLSMPLELNIIKKSSEGLMPYELMKKAEESYERHLFFIKNQAIQFVGKGM